MSDQQANLVELAADIVAAYVAKNSIPLGELPNLIAVTHSALAQLGHEETAAAAPVVPAVSIKKSITPDFLICLDDGTKFKSLKRHLGKLGMTPEQYRTKWGLPADYPMVAPNYAEARSRLAKSMGLGQLKKAAPAKKRKAG